MKKYIGLFIAILVLMFAAALLQPSRIAAVTASYNKTIQIVSSAGTVLDGVASATTASYNETVQVVDHTGHVIDSFVNGGNLVATTGAPMWARYFGTGADGAGPASGGWGAATYVKNLTSWTCTGAVTTSSATSIIALSQGTIALNTGCSLSTSGINANQGDIGGAGGSGGGGAAASVASLSTTGNIGNVTGNTGTTTPHIYSTGAALSAVAGNNATAGGTPLNEMLFDIGYGFRTLGGGPGTAGGSSGGAAGLGAGCIILIAPTITIASGVTLDASGANGVAPTANSTGAGGGGGGGCIWMVSQTFTDSGGIYKYGGGPGGAITQPAIYATGGGCDTTGCGTGAQFTVTGLTGGGLDASKITITAAGSGYKTAPVCTVYAGGSSLAGSPACHFTISAGAIASVVIDTAGTGGTLTTFTTTFIGGFGAVGNYFQQLIS